MNQLFHQKLHQLTEFSLLLLIAAALCACGKDDLDELEAGHYYYYPSTETETAEETESAEATGLYLIISNDTAAETLHLYDYGTGREYMYHYALSTNFTDKYGNHSSSANFTPGKVVWIGGLNSQDKLTEVGMSDLVWEYDNVTRFTASEEDGALTIADSTYKYETDSFTFYGDNLADFDSLTQDDVISVIGLDNKILSVCIITGHGTIQLSNTELFEGSFLQLGTRIFAEITPDMSLSVPEGTYTLSVANDGWGGTEEITVVAGETLQVDLDTLKGEGPSYGNILFVTDVDAYIYIDGEQIDQTSPVALTYGKHSLVVMADGYDTFSRTLYVNSAEATIEITLGDEEDSSDDTDTASDSEETDDSDSTDTTSEETDSDDSDSTDSDDYSDLYDYLTDYLSTLSSVID